MLERHVGSRASLQVMQSKVILDDVNAMVKPSTTTLILGPPGCGKVSPEATRDEHVYKQQQY